MDNFICESCLDDILLIEVAEELYQEATCDDGPDVDFFLDEDI